MFTIEWELVNIIRAQLIDLIESHNKITTPNTEKNYNLF